jgi:flagellar basal-body rod protein FlgG
MLRALNTAASGMKVQELTVDNISHNLANANTTAFKKSRLEFEDLLYLNIGNSEGQASAENQVSPGLQIGSGARTIANLKSLSQGTLEETQRELDVAIDGEGFLPLSYRDNETAYTRDGSFKLDSQRRLVSSHGYPLQPAITIPENASKIYIGRDGVVSVAIEGQNQLQTVAEIVMARFPNPSGLSSEGSNLLKQTAASGEAILNKPGVGGNGTLSQSMLERSNVDVVSEMVRLITAQRAYEINSKVIRSGDEMLSMVNNLVR